MCGCWFRRSARRSIWNCCAWRALWQPREYRCPEEFCIRAREATLPLSGQALKVASAQTYLGSGASNDLGCVQGKTNEKQKESTNTAAGVSGGDGVRLPDERAGISRGDEDAEERDEDSGADRPQHSERGALHVL